MAEIKCSRCDRRYSSLRGRCPYCGTRRRSKGKRVADADNSLWKLVIGALLLVVLIVAVIILIVSAVKDGGDKLPATSPSPSFSHGDGVTNSDDPSEPSAEPSIEPSPSPSPSAPLVQSVAIYAYGNQKAISGGEKGDVTLKLAEKCPFTVKVTPEGSGSTPVWATSNEDIVTILQDGTVTAIGKGEATISVTVDGVTAECLIRVK